MSLPALTADYKILHWDTFDNVTLEIGSAPSLEEAETFVRARYGSRLAPDGADIVDIRLNGKVVRQWKTR